MIEELEELNGALATVPAEEELDGEVDGRAGDGIDNIGTGSQLLYEKIFQYY